MTTTPAPTKAPRKTTTRPGATLPTADVSSSSSETEPRPARSKVGQLVGFTTNDPITGDEIAGRGFVVEDEDGQVLLAPLPATLGIRIPHDQLTD